MYVVPDTSAIFSWIVLSKDVEPFTLAHNDLLDERKKVIRVFKRLVSQHETVMSSTRVKVSERNDFPVRVNFYK